MPARHRLVAGVTIPALIVMFALLGYLIRPQPELHQPGVPAGLVATQPAATRVQVSGPGRLVADARWVRRTAATAGIPTTAVQAYANATLQLDRSAPGCHLGWTTLAGVGTVESGNGTIGGRTLLADGRSDPPVTGPALNGAGGFAALKGSDGKWSKALGPMQFLPSSWARWASDGNGDGSSDIDNIFDAALAAGRYLCADGHDLATATGWSAAIYSYNHSADYVRTVYGAAVAAGS